MRRREALAEAVHIDEHAPVRGILDLLPQLLDEGLLLERAYFVE